MLDGWPIQIGVAMTRICAASTFDRIDGQASPSLVGGDAEPYVVIGDPDELTVDIVVGERGQHLAAEQFRARRGRRGLERAAEDQSFQGGHGTPDVIQGTRRSPDARTRPIETNERSFENNPLSVWFRCTKGWFSLTKGRGYYDQAGGSRS
ncbi:hypothetical protein [Actinoplanes xinjiangensis]|uniref:hypothetical protein n=1 Tax=Actinoplanes xinjiangensis TaxID=512350 RepID=UPI00343CFFF8